MMPPLLRLALACLALAAPHAAAQQDVPTEVPIAWNKYYTYPEMEEHLHAIAEAYPDLVELREIGKSLEGRSLWVAIVTGPDAAATHADKPAMWIDGNVHGNEIQAGEVVLYTAWYLTRGYGHIADITELLDNYTFYLMVSQNPDGREAWFAEPSTPHSSRHNRRPTDNDNDGLVDEDPYDDLDGDGSITGMWKQVPMGSGRWRRDVDDPRIFTRVEPDQEGDWEYLGAEGLDNDGDGRINEDGPFGDDMNRNWASDWQPEYIQRGAGPWPLSAPEVRTITEFIAAHPNIAAGQSYHNSGGMILRGPGTSYRDGMYPRSDSQVYDELARTGDLMLPYYRDMVIYRDLYNVHGGFVNYLAEGLGVFSFTNEMWASGMMYQKDIRVDDEKQWLWRDRMMFGQTFKDYTEYDHPDHGKVLIGGPNKWSSRNTPTFMLEEECHRNFAFTAFHADQMPLLSFKRTEVEQLAGNLWQLTVEVANEKIIPTRSALAQARGIGAHDILTTSVDAGSVVTAGRMSSWLDRQMNAIRHEPGRIQVEDGVPGHDSRIFRILIEAAPGAEVTLRYTAEKARDIELQLTLE